MYFLWPNTLSNCGTQWLWQEGLGRCCTWLAVAAAAVSHAQSRSKHREPHEGILEDTPAVSFRCGGGKSCCKALSIFSSHRSHSAHRSAQAEVRVISQCHSILPFLSLNSAKLFGAEGHVFLEKAYKQVARMAWAILPVASWVTGRERAKELQNQGKWVTQGSICVYLDVSSGCLHIDPVIVGNNGCPRIRELCSKARHPNPPCKAAMNPFSLDTAIWVNTLARHPAYE